MKKNRFTFAHTILLIFSSFLALTAIPGGIALFAGWNTPPVSMLEGSPFGSFVIPGLALACIVGGSALLAAVALIKKIPSAPKLNLVSAAIILIFETVEIHVIGSPAGVARNLQILYIALGIAMLLTAGRLHAQQEKRGSKNFPQVE